MAFRKKKLISHPVMLYSFNMTPVKRSSSEKKAKIRRVKNTFALRFDLSVDKTLAEQRSSAREI